MFHQRALVILALTFCVSRTTSTPAPTSSSLVTRGRWQRPGFTTKRDCRRVTTSTMMITSFVLHVSRGGSDRSGAGDYYGRDEYYDRRRNTYGHAEEEEKYPPTKRPYNDDYYGEQGENYYEEEKYYDRDYDDRGSRKAPVRPSSTSSPSLASNVPSIIKNGDRKIGLALLGSGAVFTLLGISLFFNKSLLRMGNLLFIAGVPMTIGPGRTAGYFFQPKKSRATACLVLGILLVLSGNPIFGMALEIFGLLNLFGNMFPLLAVMMKQLPVVGTLFSGSGNAKSKKATPSRRDGQYDDDRYYDRGDRYYDEGDREQDSSERYY